MRIIGLAGPAGVGKDTIADYLVLHHNYRQRSFALPLKNMVAYLGAPLPETREEKEGPHPILKNVTWRQIMQELGTECFRKLNPDTWVLVMEEKIQQLKERDIWWKENLKVVISDVRFENEATWIRSEGGEIWHILRNDAPKVRAHQSEAGIQVTSEDRIIYNNGTIRELTNLVEMNLHA